MGKAAVDKMSIDMAVDFKIKKKKVAVLSLWPGLVKTEFLMSKKDSYKRLWNIRVDKIGEDPEYTGYSIANLYNDKNLMKMTGEVLNVGDLAIKYGFLSYSDNRQPQQMGSIQFYIEAGLDMLKSKFEKKEIKIEENTKEIKKN